MKPVLVFIAAFTVATAASTGASVAMHKGRGHPADSLAVTDSAAAGDSAAHDSAGAGPLVDTSARHDTVASAQTRSPTAAAVPTVPPPLTASPGRSANTLPSGTPSADSMANAGKWLSRLFAAMAPAEAAKTLEHFSDADVQVILSYIGAKQAAPILALMPPERVAALGKAVLHGRGQ